MKDIESLRDNQVREDHQPEYKAGSAFSDPDEITRDVSSFAMRPLGLSSTGWLKIKDLDKGSVPRLPFLFLTFTRGRNNCL